MSQLQVDIAKRFDELTDAADRTLLKCTHPTHTNTIAFYTWTASVLSFFHGVFGYKSPQYMRFNSEISSIKENYVSERQLEACYGIFLAAKSDFVGGHLFDIEKSVSGELFGDFVALAKSALSEKQHAVAAVLASAALEDALKRYAIANDLAVEGNTMEQIVNALKSQGLVSGPQKALLSAMPKIRNHAMHADWDKLTPQDVGSMIGFVEHFLLANFS